MQTVLTSPFDASQSGFFGQSPHAGDLRAMETRLSAQMDALEAKMSELMGDAVHRVTLPRATTPVAPSAVKSAQGRRRRGPRRPRRKPRRPTRAPSRTTDEEPRDASFDFSCVFGEGAWPVKPKGKLSLVVAPEETISTVRCAVASKLDLEVDRIRLRDASNGEDIGTAADLEAADVVCQIVTGDLISDGQVEDPHA